MLDFAVALKIIRLTNEIFKFVVRYFYRKFTFAPINVIILSNNSSVKYVNIFLSFTSQAEVTTGSKMVVMTGQVEATTDRVLLATIDKEGNMVTGRTAWAEVVMGEVVVGGATRVVAMTNKEAMTGLQVAMIDRTPTTLGGEEEQIAEGSGPMRLLCQKKGLLHLILSR